MEKGLRENPWALRKAFSGAFQFFCSRAKNLLPNVFQQRVVIHKPPFPTLVGCFNSLSCSREAESVLVMIAGEHRCAGAGTFTIAGTIDNLRVGSSDDHLGTRSVSVGHDIRSGHRGRC